MDEEEKLTSKRNYQLQNFKNEYALILYNRASRSSQKEVLIRVKKANGDTINKSIPL